MKSLEIILNNKTLEIYLKEINEIVLYNIETKDFKPYLFSKENMAKYKKSSNGLWIIQHGTRGFLNSYKKGSLQFEAFNQIIAEAEKIN